MRLIRPLLLVFALALLALPALGSIVLEVTVEQLAEKADRIVRGRVVEQSVLLERGGRAIWTRYHVRVEETLAGEGTKEVVVHVPGGRMGELRQEVHGVARLRTNDEVVVFLWKDRQGRLRVLGQAQGAFRVRAEGRSGVSYCTNSVHGLVLVDPTGKPRRGRAQRVPLTDLRARVAKVRRELDAAREREREAARLRLAERLRRAKLIERLSRGKPGTAE